MLPEILSFLTRTKFECDNCGWKARKMRSKKKQCPDCSEPINPIRCVKCNRVYNSLGEATTKHLKHHGYKVECSSCGHTLHLNQDG